MALTYFLWVTKPFTQTNFDGNIGVRRVNQGVLNNVSLNLLDHHTINWTYILRKTKAKTVYKIITYILYLFKDTVEVLHYLTFGVVSRLFVFLP